MARGAKLSDEKKLYIAEMLEKGCTYQQIKNDMHVSGSTIAAVKREFYGKDDDVKKAIVAGDKFNGLLECVGSNQYAGSCRVHGGKFKRRRFNCNGSSEAKKQWEAWKDELHAEEKPVNNTPIEVKPMRKPPLHPEEADYNARYKDDDAIVTQVAIPNNPTVVTTPAIVTTPPVESTVPRKTIVKHIYVLAVGNPKLAGWFVDARKAHQAMEAANKALEFAGVDVRYSVMEVERQE